jgi:hypothetical protein
MVCTPMAPDQAPRDGEGACTLCADATACGLTVDATATKASTKSPDKSIKVKDKRSCKKDKSADGGKACTRTLTFGKRGALAYTEYWAGDKARASIYFRPDSGAAVVSFNFVGRMEDDFGVETYVVDLPAPKKAKKVKATLACALPKKSAEIADPLHCTITQKTADTDDMSGYVATIQTSWKDHKGVAHTSESIDAGMAFDLDLSPAIGDGVTPDFTPCTDFQIDAKIESRASGVAWQKTLKVKQKCKWPKAKLACTGTDPDGKTYDELKKQYRLPEDAKIECRLSGVDLTDGAADAWITATSTGKQTQVHGSLDGQDLVFTLDAANDLAECDTTQLDLTVVDDRNIPWFAKSAKLTENCPD